MLILCCNNYDSENRFFNSVLFKFCFYLVKKLWEIRICNMLRARAVNVLIYIPLNPKVVKPRVLWPWISSVLVPVFNINLTFIFFC